MSHSFLPLLKLVPSFIRSFVRPLSLHLFLSRESLFLSSSRPVSFRSRLWLQLSLLVLSCFLHLSLLISSPLLISIRHVTPVPRTSPHLWPDPSLTPPQTLTLSLTPQLSNTPYLTHTLHPLLSSHPFLIIYAVPLISPPLTRSCYSSPPSPHLSSHHTLNYIIAPNLSCCLTFPLLSLVHPPPHIPFHTSLHFSISLLIPLLIYRLYHPIRKWIGVA